MSGEAGEAPRADAALPAEPDAAAPAGDGVTAGLNETERAALDVALRALAAEGALPEGEQDTVGVGETPAAEPQPAASPGAAAEPGASAAASGMDRILTSGLVAYERLPMLEIVFDRLVRITSTSMRNFTSDNVEVSFNGIQTMRFGDYLDELHDPTMIAVFRAEQWDNYGLVIVDAMLAYTVVDVLLGGRPSTVDGPIRDRAFTTIERALIERLAQLVLTDLSEAFAPLGAVKFTLDRLEVNPRFAAISSNSNAALLGRLRVEIDSRGGELQVLLPYATLEPVRELLLQQFMGERLGRDSIWETHLSAELRQTEVALDVVLDDQVMEFGSLAGLRVGDRLPLSVGPNAPVRLLCGGTPIFEGRAGRREGRLAVQIERVLPQKPGRSA